MDPVTLQDALFEIARGIREREEVQPIAFLVTPAALVQVHLFQIPKDRWRATILRAIADTRAAAVVVHTEAWTVTGKDAPTAMAAKMAGLDSLKEFPGREEVLQSAMEAADGTTRTLVATISPDGKLGPTEVHTRAPILGEMVGFFPATAQSSR